MPLPLLAGAGRGAWLFWELAPAGAVRWFGSGLVGAPSSRFAPGQPREIKNKKGKKEYVSRRLA